MVCELGDYIIICTFYEKKSSNYFLQLDKKLAVILFFQNITRTFGKNKYLSC